MCSQNPTSNIWQTTITHWSSECKHHLPGEAAPTPVRPSLPVIYYWGASPDLSTALTPAPQPCRWTTHLGSGSRRLHLFDLKLHLSWGSPAEAKLYERDTKSWCNAWSNQACVFWKWKEYLVIKHLEVKLKSVHRKVLVLLLSICSVQNFSCTQSFWLPRAFCTVYKGEGSTILSRGQHNPTHTHGYMDHLANQPSSACLTDWGGGGGEPHTEVWYSGQNVQIPRCPRFTLSQFDQYKWKWKYMNMII